ncbi:MAG: hypothetical protein IT495_09585 [Gammaproteobacteria bacterium]|nr:hypothetical protein [Gammaproteobacteria bacterium]
MATAMQAATHSALALAVARIHRSRSASALRRTFFEVAPTLVDADAFGLYLLDDRLHRKAVFATLAEREFLEAYEALRDSDPCFRALIDRRRFTHTLEVIDEPAWVDHPLCRLMSQWGLRYSIAAPLVIAGRLVGTINFARCGRGYFDPDSLVRARFLCEEFDFAFARIAHIEALERLARPPSPAPALQILPARTRTVAELAATGLTNRAIAAQLGISDNTVRDHLKRAYAALGVNGRTALARRL